MCFLLLAPFWHRDVTSTILNSGKPATLMTSYQQFWTAARLTGLDKHAVYIIANNSLILSPILIKFLLICSQWIIRRFWRQSIWTSTWRRFKHTLLVKKTVSPLCRLARVDDVIAWRHGQAAQRVACVLLTKAYTIRTHVFYVRFQSNCFQFIQNESRYITTITTDYIPILAK